MAIAKCWCPVENKAGVKMGVKMGVRPPQGSDPWWGLTPVLLLLALHADASGLERLKQFVSGTENGRAEFTQTTLNAQGKTEGTASTGTFEFSRPGKFRWEYRSPFPQTIVGDGQTLWIWDPDLRQVTRKKLTQSLGSTPAALLAGDNALEKGFTLKEGGASEALEWVDATPKNTDSGFEHIRLGFGADSLARMELQDSFGHTISIRFNHVDKRPIFGANTFHFTPPAGADVIW